MSASGENTSSTNNNQSTNNDRKRGCNYCDVIIKLLRDMPFLITMLLNGSFFIAFIIVMLSKPDLLK